MELQDYLRIFKAHWVAVLLLILLGGGLAFGWALMQPKVYTANGSAIISTGSTSTLGDALVGDNFAKSRVRSYLDIAKSRQVGDYARQELGLSVSADHLVSRVRVSNPVDTAVLRVSASGSSPEQARDLVEAWIAGMKSVVAQLEGGDSIVSLNTLDSAVLPTQPSSPNTKLSVALGLMLGFAAGVAYALIRSSLDRRLRSAAAIEREFDVPVLGSIPLDSAIAKRGLVGVQPDFHTAESVRALRTNLRFMDVDNPPRVVVISSCLPGDGKSTVAIQLAQAIAESGQRVVLVDADLRRPSTAEYLGLATGAGLTDVLVGRVEIGDVLQAYGNTGRMWVLGAGVIPPNPSELLGSDAMHSLLHSLPDDTFVLVDTAPLLPVTDAAILTARTDGALVVTRAGKTTIDQLDKALGNLERVKGRSLGVILNGTTKSSRKEAYYGYEYRYDVEPKGRARSKRS